MDRSASGADGGARDFFEGYARDFDHIYEEGGKGAFARYVDTSLRKEMRIRFEKTFESLAPMQGRSMLDAGCGGGRYAIPAAKAGASQVLGIDFSPTMLDLARQKATAEGVGNVCRFELGDLLTYPVAEKSFDYAIAIGFFDYQKDPEAALRALVARGQAARLRVAAEALAPAHAAALRPLHVLPLLHPLLLARRGRAARGGDESEEGHDLRHRPRVQSAVWTLSRGERGGDAASLSSFARSI